MSSLSSFLTACFGSLVEAAPQIQGGRAKVLHVEFGGMWAALGQIFDCSVLILPFMLSLLQALFQLSPEAAGPCLDH